MDSRYATVSLTPSTSRNCNDSAPGTTPDLQVAPPSVVRANVPPRPLAQTTRLFTGLTAISPCVVPLPWGVSVGWRGAAPAAELVVTPASPVLLSPPTSATATTASDIHLRRMRFPFGSLHVCSKPLLAREDKTVVARGA